MHVFKNVHVCVCTRVYRQACRQKRILKEGTKQDFKAASEDARGKMEKSVSLKVLC